MLMKVVSFLLALSLMTGVSVGFAAENVKDAAVPAAKTESGKDPYVYEKAIAAAKAEVPETAVFQGLLVEKETDKTVTPEIKVFNDCVVFLPYFSSNGSFGCFVYMNGKQISLEDFCMLYADENVYLTRVRANEQFYPD